MKLIRYYSNFIFMVLLSHQLMAATYYVQVDGDDQNSGTSSTIDGAWRSLNFAFDQLKGGDTLIIGDGFS